MVVGAAINIASKFLNWVMEKRLAWCKEEGVVGYEVQNLIVQNALNPIKLSVRVAEKR
jgi:hypothetical protein